MIRHDPVSIESIDDQILPAVLQLNNDHAEELSLLTRERLGYLLERSFHARRVGLLDALLIAFDQKADYDSENYRWFRARYPAFVYVDRVVVAPSSRGQGLARALYEDLFQAARNAGHTIIGCEVNAQPPNPASDAFHSALGFREVGTAMLGDGRKSVRYFVRSLDAS